ncbi:hypothetical protein [Halorhabdus amylolytica]|uniref:hypothetical protein n=1 Tax=Halorhabdus amylolytica TaxID=2559573 RepID=UPI0010AAC5FF|nr:hypothetical protein [Halorhabdus amylolytica]
MPPTRSDSETCPVCGEPYDQRIVVARGDQWGDLYAGPPLSFFRKYRRRCTAREDVETGETLAERERAVYFHGKRHSY